ncbi:hypothetical protein [Gordonia aichiensis]|uniref:hypothetical protein n=1 Tax=Gordonia aichiensis TaxID=36820 RepID=UPI00326379DF
MNGALVQQVWNLQNAQLGAALPQLRPLNLDDVREVRSAFAGWLNRQRASYSSWQQAWNAWTRATERHPGRVEFTRTHCPNCHGRRYDAAADTCATPA